MPNSWEAKIRLTDVSSSIVENESSYGMKNHPRRVILLRGVVMFHGSL